MKEVSVLLVDHIGGEVWQAVMEGRTWYDAAAKAYAAAKKAGMEIYVRVGAKYHPLVRTSDLAR